MTARERRQPAAGHRRAVDLVICDRVIVLVRGERFAEFTEPPFDREALIAATEGLAAWSATDRGRA